MLAFSFLRDPRGSAARWFAYAAAAITLTAAAGAHGLAWMAHSGRLPVIAFIPMTEVARSPQGAGVDTNATGSIDAGRKAKTIP